MRTKEECEITYRLHVAQAGMAYITELFGDHLADTGQVPDDLTGRAAIEHYLMQKHHWLPAQLRAMSWSDLGAALHAEMKDWRMPAAASDVLDE